MEARCREYEQETGIPSGYRFRNYIYHLVLTKTAPLIQNYYGVPSPFRSPDDLIDFIQRTTGTGKYYDADNPVPEDPNSPLYKEPETVTDLEGNPLSIVYSVLKQGTILYKRSREREMPSGSTQMWFDYSGRPRLTPDESQEPSFTRNIFGTYGEQEYVNTSHYFGHYVFTVRTIKPLLIVHFLRPFSACDESSIRPMCDFGNADVFCDKTDGYTLDLMWKNPNEVWGDMEPMENIREITLRSRNVELINVENLGKSYYVFNAEPIKKRIKEKTPEILAVAPVAETEDEEPDQHRLKKSRSVAFGVRKRRKTQKKKRKTKKQKYPRRKTRNLHP